MEPDNRCLISLPVSRPLPSSDYNAMATTVENVSELPVTFLTKTDVLKNR